MEDLKGFIEIEGADPREGSTLISVNNILYVDTKGFLFLRHPLPSNSFGWYKTPYTYEQIKEKIYNATKS